MLNKGELDKLYFKYNDRRYVHPDPLEFLYNCQNVRDREIAGLVASSLAYGNVNQIIKNVSLILEKMKPSPLIFLKKSSFNTLCSLFSDFKYRFTTGKEISNLLFNIKFLIDQYGSLEGCFLSGFSKEDDNVLLALRNFSRLLSYGFKNNCYNSLIPFPDGRSSFKRLNLFLRWMVRKDKVDPGGWDSIPTSKLIVPLDTHMYQISRRLDLTRRRQLDIKTALEITTTFKKINRNDPVKYDFALTRLGICKIEENFLEKCI